MGVTVAAWGCNELFALRLHMPQSFRSSTNWQGLGIRGLSLVLQGALSRAAFPFEGSVMVEDV